MKKKKIPIDIFLIFCHDILAMILFRILRKSKGVHVLVFWVPVKCETKRSETKSNKTKRNRMKRNETKRNVTSFRFVSISFRTLQVPKKQAHVPLYLFLKF